MNLVLLSSAGRQLKKTVYLLVGGGLPAVPDVVVGGIENNQNRKRIKFT